MFLTMCFKFYAKYPTGFHQNIYPPTKSQSLKQSILQIAVLQNLHKVSYTVQQSSVIGFIVSSQDAWLLNSFLIKKLFNEIQNALISCFFLLFTYCSISSNVATSKSAIGYMD